MVNFTKMISNEKLKDWWQKFSMRIYFFKKKAIFNSYSEIEFRIWTSDIIYTYETPEELVSF